MISRSDWEPLPKPTLSPFARGYLSLCRFFTAAVWCVPALRVPLVHSLINHFRQNLAQTGAPCLRRLPHIQVHVAAALLQTGSVASCVQDAGDCLCREAHKPA